MKEALLCSQGTAAREQGIGRIGRRAGPVDAASGQGAHEVARGLEQLGQGGAFDVAAQPGESPGRCHWPARHQPAQRTPEVEQRVQRRDLLLGLVGQALRQARFGDVDVGEVGHLLQAAGGNVEPLQLARLEQHAQHLQAALHRAKTLAVQRVAPLEVVVQKA